MNKTQYIDHFIVAGALAKEVRLFGKSRIKPGASYQTVVLEIRQKIYDLGAIPAFPPQIALNDIAAHYLPSPSEDIIFKDELIKLDIGVCYKGAIGDCAVTIDLSGQHQKWIDAVEAALFAAEKRIQVGIPLREIGATIEKTIEGFGLKAVRNLSGHGLGYYKVHTPPTVSNYDDKSKEIIQPGMTFAIEPFATDGEGMIHEEEGAMIFSFVKEKRVDSPIASKLIAKIKTLHGLPFGLDDLVSSQWSSQELYEGLEELLLKGIIYGYGPLVENQGGMVAQAENSILVDMQGNVIITTR